MLTFPGPGPRSGPVHFQLRNKLGCWSGNESRIQSQVRLPSLECRSVWYARHPRPHTLSNLGRPRWRLRRRTHYPTNHPRTCCLDQRTHNNVTTLSSVSRAPQEKMVKFLFVLHILRRRQILLRVFLVTPAPKKQISTSVCSEKTVMNPPGTRQMLRPSRSPDANPR